MGKLSKNYDNIVPDTHKKTIKWQRRDNFVPRPSPNRRRRGVLGRGWSDKKSVRYVAYSWLFSLLAPFIHPSTLTGSLHRLVATPWHFSLIYCHVYYLCRCRFKSGLFWVNQTSESWGLPASLHRSHHRLSFYDRHFDEFPHHLRQRGRGADYESMEDRCSLLKDLFCGGFGSRYSLGSAGQFQLGDRGGQ